MVGGRKSVVGRGRPPEEAVGQNSGRSHRNGETSFCWSCKPTLRIFQPQGVSRSGIGIYSRQPARLIAQGRFVRICRALRKSSLSDRTCRNEPRTGRNALLQLG